MRSQCFTASIRVLTLIHFCTLSAGAQIRKLSPEDSPSFAVSPLEIKLTGRPGQTLSGEILLATRKFTNPVSFTIEKLDLAQEENAAIQFVEPGEGTRSCADWLAIQQRVQVQAEDRITIPYTLQIPRNVTGSYFTSVNVTTDPRMPEGDMVVRVRYRIPVRFELSVPGPALLRINVENLQYERDQAPNPSRMILTIENQGFWKTALEGDIILRQIGGGQRTVPIPYAPDGTPVFLLPGSKVKVICPMDQTLEPGRYTARVRLLMNKFGRTQAHFELAAGAQRQINARASGREEYGLALDVAPYSIEMPLRPGAVRHIPVRIVNRNEKSLDVHVSLVKAYIEKNGNFTFLDETADACTWITLSTESLNLPAQRPGIVRVQLTMPESDLPAFDDFYALRIQARPAGQETVPSGEWTNLGEATVPVFLFDAMAEPARLECVEFNLVRPSEDRAPTAAVLVIKNTGQKFAKYKGTIRLKNTAGKQYAYLDIGPVQPDILLPNQTREYRFDMPFLDEGEFALTADLKMTGRVGSREETGLIAEKKFSSSVAIPEEIRR